MRTRLWLTAGGGALLLLVAIGVVVIHELAPTRWPELAIRWSPSVDHVMRAGVTEMVHARHPSPHDHLAVVTARFPPEALERRASHDPSDALRAALFLVARATETPSHRVEAAALEALHRMAAATDPAIRWAVIANLGAMQERSELIERALMDDDHRVVEAALDRYCRGRINIVRPDSPLIASPAAIERLVVLLDATARAGLVPDSPRDPADLVRSRTVIMRWQRPIEAEATAQRVRRKAWKALAIHAPIRARASAEGREYTAEIAIAVAEGLGAAAEGVPWLVELLRHTDPHVVNAAESSLIELAWAGQRVDGACVLAAWEALVARGRLLPSLDRAAAYRYHHCLPGLRRWSAPDVERILALIPEPHLSAIVAAL